MRDMPKLIREVQDDIERECIDEIGRELYSHFSNSMRKRYIRGLPEFWKDNLKEKIVLFSE
jgi:adenylate kinase